MGRVIAAIVACLVWVSTGVQAQTPAPPKPADAAQAASPQKPGDDTKAAEPVEAAPPEAVVYTYQPDGRRDPFLSLIGTGVEPRATATRGEGPAGMSVSEISVRGVVQSRGTMLAMVQGPDNRTYILRSGDKLMDGTVKMVTAQGLVIVQEIHDPLSIEKQREVRKLLRSLEDAK